MKEGVVITILAGLLAMGGAAVVQANRYSSPNYIIDASNVGANISAITDGGSYRMVASGGESIVGQSQGGSYRLEQGYVAQLPYSLQLTVSAPSVDIPAVTPGVSQTGQAELQVRSTSPQYSVAIHQSGNLTSGSHSIPAISSGTIATPATWNEGITKGLGVTLASQSFGTLPTKWSSGSAYAALPGTATTLLSRTGAASGGSTDTATVRYRLDVSADQAAGEYTNTVTYTATWLP